MPGHSTPSFGSIAKDCPHKDTGIENEYRPSTSYTILRGKLLVYNVHICVFSKGMANFSIVLILCGNARHGAHVFRNTGFFKRKKCDCCRCKQIP